VPGPLYQPFDEEFEVTPGGGRQWPGVDLAGDGAHGQRHLAARVEIEVGTLLLGRLAYRLVVGQGPYILQGDVKEAVGHLQQLVEDVVPLLGAVNHVGQHPETGYAMVAAEQLDEGVGIGDRGGLVTYHYHHLLSSPDEADNRVADPRCGADQQHIQPVADATERLLQTGMLARPEIDHFRCPGSGRHDADATRPGDKHITQRTVAGEHVGNGGIGPQAQLDIHVGQSEVGIHQHDPAAKLGQRQGKVDRDIGLAHAALAAGDCDYLNRLIAHLSFALDLIITESLEDTS